VASIWLPVAARERRFGPHGVAGATALAGELGVPIASERIDRVLDAGARELDVCVHDIDDVFELARRWADRRHFADLRALAARVEGPATGAPPLRIVVDPTSGEHAVVGTGCDGRAFAVNLRHVGEGFVEAAEDARDALRLGGVTAAISRRAP
jgi:hypothetical protein